MFSPARSSDGSCGIRECQDEDGDKVEDFVFPGEVKDSGDCGREENFPVGGAFDAVEDVSKCRLQRGDRA